MEGTVKTTGAAVRGPARAVLKLRSNPPGSDPTDALLGYLTEPRTATAWHLAKKAIVLLDPEPLRGKVVWPAGRSCP